MAKQEQFNSFSPQNITGLDGKILNTVNIDFSQSNSWILYFPVLVTQSHIIKENNAHSAANQSGRTIVAI